MKMKYQTPDFELVMMEAEDIVTLSVVSDSPTGIGEDDMIIYL